MVSGHPRALATLFFTEMWERFTFYGMRALLVLFLVDAVSNGGYGLDDKTATAIYGLYTAAVFMAALPGGWIADRLIGAQRAVMLGGALMTLGNLMLVIPGPKELFFGGLVVIILGVGLLKPNISTLVADLYPEGGGRRDAGFTIFYMGINLGAFIGPLIAGWLAHRYGWRIGFLAAAIGLPLGLAQFWLSRHRFNGAGARHNRNDGEAGLAQDWRRLWIAAGDRPASSPPSCFRAACPSIHRGWHKAPRTCWSAWPRCISSTCLRVPASMPSSVAA